MYSKRILLATCLLASASLAGAQQYPTKPIRFIAPFPAAGSSDLIARVLSQRMSEELGQPVVVDNRPGASGSVGTALAAKSPADGYTLLLGSIAALAINPRLLKNVGYDSVKDFIAVAALGQGAQLLVVNPTLPAKSVQEFLALARKKPNALSCGSGGVGTPAHFGCELLRLRGNAQLLHVPYKGTGQSVNDLMGNQVHVVFADTPVALPHVRSGRLRALAVTSPQRSPLTPELPTMLEAGVRDFVTQGWWGAFVPAGTPGLAVRRLGEVIARVLQEPKPQEQLALLGVEPLKLTPRQMGELVRTELDHYGRLVKEIGIAAQ